MGTLTYSINVTLDGCIDHREGIADEETHAWYTRQLEESDGLLWGRVVYEMMESYWPAVARGETDASPTEVDWARTLERMPKYVVSTTRTDFPWTGSHLLTGDLRTAVQDLKDSTPSRILLGSPGLATALDRLDLIDEYRFLVHPVIAGHGPTLHGSSLPASRHLDLVSSQALTNGVVALRYVPRHPCGAALSDI